MIVPAAENNLNDAQASSHREDSRFFLFNSAPVAPWITKNKSSQSWIWVLLLIWLVFSSLVGAYTYQLGQVYNHRHEGNSLLNNTETAIRILKEMNEDKYHCFHCISNHTTNETISQLTQTSKNLLQQQIQIRRMGFILYLFSMFNIALVSVVFPGPFILNILSFINVICLLLALYVNQFDVVICVDSIVVLVSVVHILYISYRVMTAMHNIPQRHADKSD